MQKITPHLWFDKEAKDAAEFYTTLIPGSTIKNVSAVRNTPSGDCDMVTFDLAGQPFMAISAGPLFKFNPSVSFHLKCKTKEGVDSIWAKLSEGGNVMMPLGSYPFSGRYGWIEDKYGLSWQVMYASENEIKQAVTPVLMFMGEVCGKAEEAIASYTSIFGDPLPQILSRYGRGEEPDKEGTIRYGQFTLHGQEFGAMDSARQHNFAFNEAISFIVPCESQQEIDHYWNKLSADPNAGQCGWLKDKYGLSWQITPTVLNQLMSSKDPQKVARVTQAFLRMKKFDIAALQQAYDGK